MKYLKDISLNCLVWITLFCLCIPFTYANGISITCPSDISTSTDFGQCDAVVNFSDPFVSGGEGTVTVSCSPSSGSTFPVGTTTVTCTATDDAGNTATCSFNITVFDSQPPFIECSDDINTVTDPGQCDAVVVYGTIVGDNCSGLGVDLVCNPPPYSSFPVGTTKVTCTATDAAGNTATCSFDVTVVDNEPPSITCPPNIYAHAELGQCDAVVVYTATASDNCTFTSLSCTPPSGSTFPLGFTTVTCTATDAAGNTATCSFGVIVFDNEPPSIFCPANIRSNTDPGQCDASLFYNVSASDNCTAPDISCAPSSTIFPVGTTTVTCTATDDAGNSATCSFDVTVVDNEPPTITCPPDIVTNTDPGQCGAVVTYAVTGTDNCPVTVSCNPSSGSFFPVGTSTVNCTATDASGNTATCSFKVTVISRAEIDVKPRSCPNPLNIVEMGVIPVAILGGNPCFNLNDIDLSTVLLNGVAPLRYLTDDVASPVPNRRDGCDCTTLGRDGFLDLIFYFDAKQVIATLGAVNNGDVKVLTLTANLFNGNSIEGKDCVRINSKSKSGATSTSFSTPTDFELKDNFPNPFNATTSISYSLSTEGFVTLNIYNILGQKVRTLVQEHQTSGYKTVIWDGKNDSGEGISSGIYLYRIQVGEFSETKRMTLLK